VLSEKDVSAYPHKVKAVERYRNTKNAIEVRAFWGPSSFYRRLVPDLLR
jgi:hypothetical protein